MHCSIPISMAQNKGELLGYARSVIPFSSWFWTKLRYLWNCDVCPHWFRQLIRWFLLALICDSSTSICNSKNTKLASLSPKLWKAVGTESQSAMRVRDLHHDRLCLIQKLLYIYIKRQRNLLVRAKDGLRYERKYLYPRSYLIRSGVTDSPRFGDGVRYDH